MYEQIFLVTQIPVLNHPTTEVTLTLADNGRKIKFGTPTRITKLAVNAH